MTKVLQGTKAILFDKHGKIVQRVNAAHAQIYPHPGWVEHDPEEIVNKIYKTIDDLVNITGIEYEQISAIGISNQREDGINMGQEFR